MIYLDYAATAPVPQAVADAMYEVLAGQFGNPSSQYPLGLEMKKRVELWRRTVAEALGCEPKQLFFTSCGTEADNWAIRAALWQNRHLGRHVVTTAVEHSAVLESCKWLEREGYELTYLAPDQNGDIQAEQVLAAVRPDTALVSMMLVNNELGNLYPVRPVAQGLAEKNPRTLLHTDAVQGFGLFSVKRLGADLVTVSAHKIGGPKGIGALYAGPRVKSPKPLLAGGGQESGFRSGTEATAQIAGFAKAAELRMGRQMDIADHLAGLRTYAIQRLLEIPDLQILNGAAQASHILAVSLPGWPSQNIVNDLGGQGICISAGSACHRGRASHVLTAMSIDKRTAAGTLRVSLGPETTMADIEALAEALADHQSRRFPML